MINKCLTLGKKSYILKKPSYLKKSYRASYVLCFTKFPTTAFDFLMLKRSLSCMCDYFTIYWPRSIRQDNCHLQKCVFLKDILRVWKDGTAIKSAYCFCRGPKFQSHSHVQRLYKSSSRGSSDIYVTAVLTYLHIYAYIYTYISTNRQTYVEN